MPTLGKSERGPFTLLPSVDIHRTDWLTMSIGDFVGCHCKPKASKHHILRHTPELLGGRESCVQSSKTWCYGLVGLHGWSSDTRTECLSAPLSDAVPHVLFGLAQICGGGCGVGPVFDRRHQNIESRCLARCGFLPTCFGVQNSIASLPGLL